MYRLTVLYHRPADPAGFDRYYAATHVPLARRIPDLRGLRAAKTDSIDGTTPEIYMIVELDFDSRAALETAMQSPAGQAAAADVAHFADGGVTMLGTEVDGVA